MRVLLPATLFSLFFLSSLSLRADNQDVLTEHLAPNKICDHLLTKTPYQLLKMIIRSPYQQDALQNEKRFSQEQIIINSAIALSEVERKKLLKEVKKHKSTSHFFHLLLYDEMTWTVYFDEILGTGVDSTLMNEYSNLIINLPENLKNKFLSLVPFAYHQAHKSKYENEHLYTFTPKRAIDGMLRLLLRGDRIVLDALNKKATPIQSYEEYFKKMDEVFQGTQMPYYNGQVVLAIARGLQAQLQSYIYEKKFFNDVASGFDRDVYRRGAFHAEYELTISGSFPNGLADPELSDIDLSFSDQDLYEMKDRFFASMNSVFSSFSITQMRLGIVQGSDDAAKALLNPFLIKVTKDSIRLVVHRPSAPKYEASDSAEVFQPISITLE